MMARLRLRTASMMGIFCLPLTYQLVARFRNLVEYWGHLTAEEWTQYGRFL